MFTALLFNAFSEYEVSLQLQEFMRYVLDKRVTFLC